MPSGVSENSSSPHHHPLMTMPFKFMTKYCNSLFSIFFAVDYMLFESRAFPTWFTTEYHWHIADGTLSELSIMAAFSERSCRMQFAAGVGSTLPRGSTVFMDGSFTKIIRSSAAQRRIFLFCTNYSIILIPVYLTICLNF